MASAAGMQRSATDPVRSLFLIEYALGHRTHTRFLAEYLGRDSRFDARVSYLRDDQAADAVGAVTNLPLPFLGLVRRRGVGLWVWRVFRHHRHEAAAALRDVDLNQLDLLYIHTHTAGSVILDIPRSIRTAVSVDLTWKLVFQHESRYADSRLFAPIYKLERRIFERADLITSFSEWAASSVINDYGIPPSKVSVIPNGVSIPDVRASQRSDGLLHIGFIGNEFRRKGGDMLLRVHQEHFADRSHLTLITSDPVPRSRLKNVTLRQQVPWEQLMTEILPSFDVFVFPTRFDYSPYAVIEALTVGVPVIASSAGAIPEMIREGVDGLLINADETELADRLDWALANRDQLRAMGESARSRASHHYAAAQNYPRLLDLLAQLAATQPRVDLPAD